MTELSSPKAFPVIQIREVRAADADEATEVSIRELVDLAHIDPGVVGAVAGGEVFGVRDTTPGDGWDSLTPTGALVEAAIYFLRAAFLEGDDGTGGVVTEQEVAAGIDLATDALATMKESRGV